MTRNLLRVLAGTSLIALGFWAGRASKPAETVMVPIYQLAPMPTDCGKCKTL